MGIILALPYGTDGKRKDYPFACFVQLMVGEGIIDGIAARHAAPFIL
jgi:hypothetical protein